MHIKARLARRRAAAVERSHSISGTGLVRKLCHNAALHSVTAHCMRQGRRFTQRRQSTGRHFGVRCMRHFSRLAVSPLSSSCLRSAAPTLGGRTQRRPNSRRLYCSRRAPVRSCSVRRAPVRPQRGAVQSARATDPWPDVTPPRDRSRRSFPAPRSVIISSTAPQLLAVLIRRAC